MRTIELTVGLPPASSSPNGSHGYWAEVSRARRILREETSWHAQAARREQCPVGWTPGRATVSLVFATNRKGPENKHDGLYRPQDIPNAIAAFKGGFDGLKDGGLIRDDSWRWMELGRVEIDPDTGPGVRVVVEVEDF